MRLFASVLLLLFAATFAFGDVATHEFDELIGAPSGVVSTPLPFSFDVEFDDIDSITFNVAGTASPHSWDFYDLNFGYVASRTFDAWSVDVWKIGHADRAVATFEASGSFDFDLIMSDIGGGWDDLESGELVFTLRPVYEIGHIATMYGVLASEPMLTLDEATLQFAGKIASEATGDFNGDGVVDAADFVMWRKQAAVDPSAASYATWASEYGRNMGGGAGADASFQTVPEPASLVVMVALAVSLASLGRPAGPERILR